MVHDDLWNLAPEALGTQDRILRNHTTEAHPVVSHDASQYNLVFAMAWASKRTQLCPQELQVSP